MAANSRFAVAIHALALIACGEDARSSREIAGSVATNPVVIRRLLAQLSRAGIVTSAHGAKGGFRLARTPAKIRLYDIYAAVEEGGFFALPEKGNDKCPIACRMNAILGRVFERVQSSVVPELKRSTLADVVGQLPKTA